MIRSIKDTENYLHDFKTAFAPYPVVEEGQRNYTQGGYGDLLCINPKSENVEAAWEFAKWYATDGMLPMAEGGRVPAANTYDPEAVTSAFLNGAEDLLDAASTRVYSSSRQITMQYLPSQIILQKYQRFCRRNWKEILIDQKTVEQGLTDAKTRADAILVE